MKGTPPSVDPSTLPPPVHRGDLRDVQDFYLTSGWSDGLPVIPPTPEAVVEFLSFTDREPDEAFATLPPQLQQATVLSVAVNGVMAGCRPEYMPVLLAAAEAIADPMFRLEDGGATPGWEPLVVVSGPLVRRLGFNSGLGLMKVGYQANATVGRFVRLFMRNVAGLTSQSETDKGSIGFTFNVALAEDGEATRRLGWPTLAEEQGAGTEQTVVMVQSVVAISPPIYSGGGSALAHMEPITYHVTSTAGPWYYTAIKYGHCDPLLVLSPSVAEGIAGDGWDKAAISKHLHQNVLLPAHLVERYPLHTEGAEVPLADYVRRGVAPALYAESADPGRLVPLLQDPATIRVVVAGDPGRNQCRAFMNNHEQGAAVARVVGLPADYDDRVDAYRAERPDPALASDGAGAAGQEG